MISTNQLISAATECWIARVLAIDAIDMHVLITQDCDGSTHTEVWKVIEVDEKIKNGEYYIVGKCHN